MSAASTMSDPANAKRPLSLGVIFLTLVIDLIGFSIIFPLAPDLIDYYLRVDGHTGALGWFLTQTHVIAHMLGKNEDFSAVLFGGVISSFFSIRVVYLRALLGLGFRTAADGAACCL